ncbi:MAG: hypothetical protein HYT16_03170 [DPANN group archaeon]|nr:hypothetical protein [DPANN group archaeon]
MVALSVKLQHRKIKGKYDEFSITIPKEILDAAPAFKKTKRVAVDVDLIGNIVVKPKEAK